MLKKYMFFSEVYLFMKWLNEKVVFVINFILDKKE